ncbi:alpha-mannosidase [Helcococcus kunzii]|uniref:alpha-mannosidase n=1 Tax=Helcococcus kunzii TaxID=40091 RepID=UPI00389B7007
MKKIVHVVSHSHWDREWYMPLENHHMRLVDLIDGVIEASEDNKFISFQMDGHFLPIEDYLKVKPENRSKVYQLIKDGKIIVGPWYILQDSFLTSGESNVRNLEIGLKKSKEIGVPAKIGYFPDTFGNIGQAPQILKKAGINNAYFGRGVKATGLANVVIEDYTSSNSEMFWQSPDGSRVLGILFANWYCNGVDIPYETDLMKKYLDTKIADMEQYASTRHLLLMNGCDHSPVQKNIGEIIEKANTLYEDYEFIHSNLEDYYEAVDKEVNKDKLSVIKGELRSQTTNGWGTLQGTSSSRYTLKQNNKNIEMRMEEIIQPLYAIYRDKKDYPYDKIEYIYKELFENHTHDAICGCSVDSVHDGNMRKFRACSEALDYLEDELKIFLSRNIENDYDEKHVFAVINTTAYHQRKTAEVEIEFEKRYFSGWEYLEITKEMKKVEVPNLQVIDENGREYDAIVTDKGVLFDFELPETKFRKGYFSRKLKVEFTTELAPFERRIFRLVESEKIVEEKEIKDTKEIDTNIFNVKINDNATITITDKRNNNVYENVLMLEDSGDIGHEYIYRQSGDNLVIKSNELIDYSIIESPVKGYIINLTEKISVPESAADTLLDEQKMVIPIEKRVSHRSDKYVDLIVEKTVVIDPIKPTINAKIKLENKAKDHRLRMMVGHDLETDIVNAESIFEVAKRPVKAPKTWENPDYSQNFNRFVEMHDKNGGFTISNNGVQEYEQLDDGLYVTLFRSTGEMGDWGHFPTPDAQLLEDLEFNFNIDFFVSDYVSSWQRALGERVPYFITQIEKNDGNIKSNSHNIDLKVGSNMFSTLYRNPKGEMILRVYNPDDKNHRLYVQNGVMTDLFGVNPINDEQFNNSYLNPYEIRTIRWEDK